VFDAEKVILIFVPNLCGGNAVFAAMCAHSDKFIQTFLKNTLKCRSSSASKKYRRAVVLPFIDQRPKMIRVMEKKRAWRAIGYALACGLYLMQAAVHSAYAADDYYSVQEYFDKYPEQKALSAHFSRIVHSAPVALKASVDAPVKVAVVYPGKQLSDYWRRSIQSFEARLQEVRVPYRISPFFSSPAADMQTQIAMITDALAEDPDYLVFTLDAQRHRAILERIIQRGRPKLILQNITTPLKKWGRRQPLLYVGFDHVQGTHMLGEFYKADLNNAGAYVLLHFGRGYISQMRGDSFRTWARDHTNFELKNQYYTDGQRQQGYAAVKKALADYPDLKFVYACATDIAHGAVDAIQEAGLEGKVFVNGWGGGSSELAQISNGALRVTVMRMNDENGVAMAEAIKLDLDGQKQKIPRIFAGRLMLIHPGVSADALRQYTAEAFHYSGVP
jgi:autoinducer 2-binding protein LuxP